MGRLKWASGGAFAAVLVVALGSFWVSGRTRRAEQLQREIEELARQRAQLLRVVERLNLEQRVAEIDVLQQNPSEDGRTVQTIIRFTELDRRGEPLPPKVFGVPGTVPHFDALVIKFDNNFIEQDDPLRGHSLALFRRVYSDTQAPNSGFSLDGASDVPDVYRVEPDPSEFELSLWGEFWSYASDPVKARRAGVRVAQGEAVYAPMSPGEHWTLTLEADGGLNLIKQADDDASADSSAPPVDAEARLHAPPPLRENGTRS